MTRSAKHWTEVSLPKPFKTLKTGIAPLDELRVLRDGEPDLVVLGARPGAGKTCLSLQIAAQVSKQGPVIYVSLEMPAEQLIERLHKEPKNQQAGDLFFEDPLWLDTAGLWERIQTQLKVEHPKLIVIDYLQIMAGEGFSKGEKIELIVTELKEIARRISVPILAVAQLNRNIEARVGEEEEYTAPQMSDFADSSAIEKWADCLLVMRRKTNADMHTKVFCLKNRHGQMKDFELVQNSLTLSFTGSASVKYDY